jgi:HAD superfamily hydrolase (TIGR01509 family)
MGNKLFKTIIFDMDGVLVDSEPHHIKIEKMLFEQLGLFISDNEHATYMGKASDVMWSEIIAKKRLSYKLEALVKQNNQESKKYFSALKNIDPMPGLVCMLDKISKNGVPMAVASSSGPETMDIILGKAGLKKYFIHTVNSVIVGKSKPEPDIFLYTARLLSVKPEECIVIEDSTNGIKAAKAAYMYCVAFHGPGAENQEQSQADEHINDFSQLDAILKKKISGWA